MTRSERIRSAFLELSVAGPVPEDELIERLARDATPAETLAVLRGGWQREISLALAPDLTEGDDDSIAEEVFVKTPNGVRSAWRPVAR